MNADSTRTALYRLVLMAGLGLSVVLLGQWMGVRPGHLLNSQSLGHAAGLLKGLGQPNSQMDFLQRVGRLLLESLGIGFLGLLLALLLATPMAIFAANFPGLEDPPKQPTWQKIFFNIIRWCIRALLSFFRAIPEIIWAFLFVRMLGLGPGPAVLAIALTFGGIIGKLYAELIEACPAAPIQALQASGCGKLGILLYGILPQIKNQWLGYALFRLECSIRSASILGVVGAGGIGAEIALSIRYYQYDRLSTALLAVLVCVIFFELLSHFLKRIHIGWSALLLCAGSLFGLFFLSIPWSDLLSSQTWEQCGRFVAGFIHPNIQSAWLWKAISLMVETLAMAWCATFLAALIAFFLAPLAAKTLALSGVLEQNVSNPLLKLGRRVLYLGSRLMMQLTRTLPELVWALLFIIWVGPGIFAGILAIMLHNVGVLGRLFSEVYEEANSAPLRALEANGTGILGRWLYGILPQVTSPILSYALFRFEVNIRMTAMIGFVGAGGIGDAIHTALSLFHFGDLATLLLVLFASVLIVDMLGQKIRRRLLSK